MRLIHAVRELNAAGGHQIETVALYTDAESSAKFVRDADFGYSLGPAADRPYLNLQLLERALTETGATGPTGSRYGYPPGHGCFAVAGLGVERAITLETGSSDRVANMHAFAAAAIDLLIEAVSAAPG